MSEIADVCIIGSGAGGGVAAWALAKKGIKVLLLEAGPRFTPASYETHALDWELQRSKFLDYTLDPESRTYEGPSSAIDPSHDALRSKTFSFYARRSRRSRRLSFFYNHSVGVGGSTLHYQGEAHRFPVHAFELRTKFGVGADWPISYAELAPYYARIEQLLGVAGSPTNPFKAARGPYPYPAHPLSPASQKVGAGAKKLGWQLLPNPVGILPKARPGRQACHYCNGCARGCMVGAKASVDVAVIPEAERTGNLHLVTGFRTSRLELGPDGKVAAAIGFDTNGSEVRHRARSFILAAGAVQTPRLLLQSVSAQHPSGLGNANDQVGRYFMETLYITLLTRADKTLRSFDGIPLDSRIWDLNGAKGVPAVPNGMVLGQGAGSLEAPVGFALEGVAGYGVEHREAMRDGFGGGIVFLGIAEQLPRFENRIVLSKQVDRRGMPLARVIARMDDSDYAALGEMTTRLNQLAEASAVDEVVGQTSAYDTPNSNHVGGGCRMGTKPEESVVDRFGRVHGVTNLVVADASVLVTQGAGDSPSLTIQALALRSAEALAKRAARGDI